MVSNTTGGFFMEIINAYCVFCDEYLYMEKTYNAGTGASSDGIVYIPMFSDPTISIREEYRTTGDSIRHVYHYVKLESSVDEADWTELATDDNYGGPATVADTGWVEFNLTLSPSLTVANDTLYRLRFYTNVSSNSCSDLVAYRRIFGIKIS